MAAELTGINSETVKLETKLKQNSIATVSELFQNCFVSVSFQLCGQIFAHN